MTEVGRRRFLAGAGATAALAAVPSRARAAGDPFAHGVASFDPTSSSVLQ